MPRRLTLRQVEAFKAVVENGSISNAAEMLHISQPAMSKLIVHFEADTGLKLFDRLKGRLAPTECGMRLYEEIDRIFAGVRQVENAAEAIRREERGQLVIGVTPALSGSFIQRATTSFLKDRPNMFCTVQSLSSHWIVDRLVARKLDVGLVGYRIDNPYVTLEPLIDLLLVCIMPLDHPLAAKSQIEPRDLDKIPFLAFHPDTYLGRRVAGMFEAYRVKAQIVLNANTTPTICEFVAAGLGVSLVPALAAGGLEHRLAVRRFEPEILFNFQLCRSADTRNAQLVEAFAQEVRATAAQISRSMLRES
jgi:DNA-binding transcriptional LysR family regulator